MSDRYKKCEKRETIWQTRLSMLLDNVISIETREIDCGTLCSERQLSRSTRQDPRARPRSEASLPFLTEAR